MDERNNDFAKSIQNEKAGKYPILRLALLAPLFPAILVGSIWFYEKTGRYITTENAYVKADIVEISAKVSGTVKNLNVKNDQIVKTGEILFELTTDRYKVAVDAAEAELAAALIKVEELKSNYRLLSVELKEAKERVNFNELKYERQKKLNQKKIGPQATFEEVKYKLEAAKQFSAGITEKRHKVLSGLRGNPNLNPSLHPLVRKAQANKNVKMINLKHTKIVSPADGVIANISLQPGEFVKAGKPVFSIVKQDGLWIEANLKETQLTNLFVGQKAEILIDAFPSLVWESTINTIGAATGAEFSLLPPQNSSGNWVKVVQRLPIRLSFKQNHNITRVRPGMSVTVTIDTRHTRSVLSLVNNAWANMMNSTEN